MEKNTITLRFFIYLPLLTKSHNGSMCFKEESERKKERKTQPFLAKFAGKVNPPLDIYQSINDNHDNNDVITVDVRRTALAVDPPLSYHFV